MTTFEDSGYNNFQKWQHDQGQGDPAMQATFYDRDSGKLETVQEMKDAAELDAAALAFAAGAPVPLIAGTFAIYDDGKGGYVLVVEREGAPEPERKHIPGALVKMFSGGLLGKRFGGLLG